MTLVREVLSMMEVNMKKVWICLAENANGNLTGYFFSIVAKIKDYIHNFIACPAAKVFWWLRWRRLLMEDVNKMIQYCFTLEQQRRVTRSKYLSGKGYAVLEEEDSDNIINAVSKEGI
jgi:hypothetical protein